jgi:predicted DNA-binding protein with PD1-like motif
MRYTRVGVAELFIAKIDPGERLPGSLIRLAENLKARLLVFYGIGGFKYAKVGFYKGEGEYRILEVSAPRNSTLEVASIIGSALWTGEKYHVHAHVVLGGLGDSELTSRVISGHLVEAEVNPLLEVFALVYSEANMRNLSEVLPHRFN